MKPPSPQARLLLERYRAGASLGADAKARLSDGVRARILRGDLPRFDVPPPSGNVPDASLAARAGSALFAKIGLGLVVAGVTGGLVYAVNSRPASPSRPAAPAPSALSVAPSPSQAPPVLEAAASASPSRPAAPAPSEPAAAASVASTHRAERRPESAPAEPMIDDEVKLMNAAQAALRAGDAKRALALSNEHAARFPTGKLATARQVTRMMALCQAGNTAQARRESTEFLAKSPRSPFADRVRGICSSR